MNLKWRRRPSCWRVVDFLIVFGGGERFWRKLFENCGRVCFSVTDKRRGERRVIGRADIFKVGSEDTTYSTSTS